VNWPCEELSCLSAGLEKLTSALTDFQLLPQAPIHFRFDRNLARLNGVCQTRFID